jgi:hypothetical protein
MKGNKGFDLTIIEEDMTRAGDITMIGIPGTNVALVKRVVPLHLVITLERGLKGEVVLDGVILPIFLPFCWVQHPIVTCQGAVPNE